MAGKKVVKETNNKFQDAMDKLNKTYGVGSILALDSKPGGDYVSRWRYLFRPFTQCRA